MNKIAVVGEEEFTLGFELVGIDSFPLTELENLISNSSDIGIIIISEKDYSTLSVKLKNSIDKLIKPIIIILSEEDIKGGNLKEAIIRALGVDLLK